MPCMSNPAQNPHSTLGVSKNATDTEITNAFRKLAMECHPDREGAGKIPDVEKFREITEAYNTLLKDTKG